MQTTGPMTKRVSGDYPAAMISFSLACALPLLIREIVRKTGFLRKLLLPVKQ